MSKGRCLCGAVTFEITGPSSAPNLCHCGMCRRHNGALGAYTGAPASAYRIGGEENVSWYQASPDAARGFCRRCGSKLFWRGTGRDTVYVPMGSLDSPTGLKAAQHIWTRHQGDYYEIDHDGLPRFADSNHDAQPIPEAPAPDPGPKKTEHSGGCLCGAVTYRVSGNMRDVVVCHCGQCRRSHGHAPGYSAARKAETTIEGADAITWYRSSNDAARGFCGQCGSSLFWRPENGDAISITASSLDAPTGMRTVRHIFVADKGDGYVIADGVPQDPGSMSSNPESF